MTEWLAVIVICTTTECAFWASTQEPIESKEKCEAVVEKYSAAFESQGIEAPLATCVPIKWIRA